MKAPQCQAIFYTLLVYIHWTFFGLFKRLTVKKTHWNHTGITLRNHTGTTPRNHIGTTLTNPIGTVVRNHTGTILRNHTGTALRNHTGTTLRNHTGTTLRNHTPQKLHPKSSQKLHPQKPHPNSPQKSHSNSSQRSYLSEITTEQPSEIYVKNSFESLNWCFFSLWMSLVISWLLEVVLSIFSKKRLTVKKITIIGSCLSLWKEQGLNVTAFETLWHKILTNTPN